MQWRAPSAAEWGLLVAAGVVAFASQLLMTFALRWVETLTAGILSQLTVVVTMALGAAWLGEGVSLMSLAGSALAMAGVVWVMVRTPATRDSWLASTRAETSVVEET